MTLKSPVRSELLVEPLVTHLILNSQQLSRQVFDTAVAWAMKADKTYFWKSQSTKNKVVAKPENAKEALTAARKSGGSRAIGPRTEEFVFFLCDSVLCEHLKLD